MHRGQDCDAFGGSRISFREREWRGQPFYRRATPIRAAPGQPLIGAMRRAAAQVGYLWFHTGCLEENAAFAARIGCVPHILVALGLDAPHASVSAAAAFRCPAPDARFLVSDARLDGRWLTVSRARAGLVVSVMVYLTLHHRATATAQGERRRRGGPLTPPPAPNWRLAPSTLSARRPPGSPWLSGPLYAR